MAEDEIDNLKNVVTKSHAVRSGDEEEERGAFDDEWVFDLYFSENEILFIGFIFCWTFLVMLVLLWNDNSNCFTNKSFHAE